MGMVGVEVRSDHGVPRSDGSVGHRRFVEHLSSILELAATGVV